MLWNAKSSRIMQEGVKPFGGGPYLGFDFVQLIPFPSLECPFSTINAHLTPVNWSTRTIPLTLTYALQLCHHPPPLFSVQLMEWTTSTALTQTFDFYYSELILGHETKLRINFIHILHEIHIGVYDICS
ncbi:Uncharacterized protein TCM_007437 [Theobroma cacao]|uniref:Uncharacterized protein n=1 Tax=Theobroma cacao TaxID=3641 RepID=A0A061E341_THECC|nr:Uncharacterized protein TCM_007437 [Theobroma cacao]